MMATATRPTQNGRTRSILDRICEKDKTAIKECIDAYGDFVWSIARRFTRTVTEAESVTEEIFRDIWRVSRQDCEAGASEKKVIATIALRRLASRRSRSNAGSTHRLTRRDKGGMIGRIPEAV